MLSVIIREDLDIVSVVIRGVIKFRVVSGMVMVL